MHVPRRASEGRKKGRHSKAAGAKESGSGIRQGVQIRGRSSSSACNGKGGKRCSPGNGRLAAVALQHSRGIVGAISCVGGVRMTVGGGGQLKRGRQGVQT